MMIEYEGNLYTEDEYRELMLAYQKGEDLLFHRMYEAYVNGYIEGLAEVYVKTISKNLSE